MRIDFCSDFSWLVGVFAGGTSFDLEQDQLALMVGANFNAAATVSGLLSVHFT
jgi:hypothetical protein